MSDETAWFWSDGHQAAEREADAAIAAGRYTEFTDAEALLEHLARLAHSTTVENPQTRDPGGK